MKWWLECLNDSRSAARTHERRNRHFKVSVLKRYPSPVNVPTTAGTPANLAAMPP